jgi:hypothetical protein
MSLLMVLKIAGIGFFLYNSCKSLFSGSTHNMLGWVLSTILYIILVLVEEKAIIL